MLFSFPIQDTTRAMRPGEVPGREYLFVTRDKMESDISAGKFIESGEYKGHLYGTSSESVKVIVNSGRVCVLSPHYQAIKSLRTPQLKPYIIHIRPPSFDRLKTTREAHRARSTFDELNSRGFTVNAHCDIVTRNSCKPWLFSKRVVLRLFPYL